MLRSLGVNLAIRWKISKSIKIVLRISALVLIVSEILIFEDFDLQKVGQGHEA